LEKVNKAGEGAICLLLQEGRNTECQLSVEDSQGMTLKPSLQWSATGVPDSVTSPFTHASVKISTYDCISGSGDMGKHIEAFRECPIGEKICTGES
jgi:hypothetical protein